MSDTWQIKAACRGASVDEIFPPESAPISLQRRSAQVVKERYCIHCVVKDECLQYAVDHDEFIGVWGGLNSDELAAYKRRLRRLLKRNTVAN